MVGKRRVALPPVLTNWAVEPLRIARIVQLPPETLMLLRYGREIDNDRFKRAGFRYRYTTSGCVDAFAQGLRRRVRIETQTLICRPAYRCQNLGRRGIRILVRVKFDQAGVTRLLAGDVSLNSGNGPTDPTFGLR